MKIGCSKLARPMVCAGYLFLKHQEIEYDESKAEEGTAASELLENLILKKPIGKMASNGVYFDDDMRFHINDVHEDILERTNSEVLTEQVINWQTRSGVVIRGKYDIAFIDKRGYLCVEDLKYGWGIVEVEENWQLLGYAIGEVIRRGQAFEKISLRIHQPRPHHEDGTSREWLIDYTTLLEYKERIETRMQEIVDGDKTLQTSKHCKYCDKSAEACPAFNRLFYRSIEVSTEFSQDNLTEQEISNQLDQIKRAEEVIKIKKDSLEELSIARIKEGKIIPKYVQVEKYSNRSWNKGISSEAIKMMTGIDINEKVMMTPAKAERKGVPKELVKQIASKKLIGMKLKKQDSTKVGNNIFGVDNPLK